VLTAVGSSNTASGLRAERDGDRTGHHTDEDADHGRALANRHRDDPAPSTRPPGVTGHAVGPLEAESL
jgi:hypothetical protein